MAGGHVAGKGQSRGTGAARVGWGLHRPLAGSVGRPVHPLASAPSVDDEVSLHGTGSFVDPQLWSHQERQDDETRTKTSAKRHGQSLRERQWQRRSRSAGTAMGPDVPEAGASDVHRSTARHGVAWQGMAWHGMCLQAAGFCRPKGGRKGGLIMGHHGVASHGRRRGHGHGPRPDLVWF